MSKESSGVKPHMRGKDAYRAAGVDYDVLDEGKRLALASALSTSTLLSSVHGGQALDRSRGESAFLFEFAGTTLALVLEGLGTKSMIARRVAEELGTDRFADVAYDTVAAILNDLCSVGALPLVANAYFATGASDWYREEQRFANLLDGWRSACVDADCTWGGGESPSLPGLVAEHEIELAGCAVGAVPQGSGPILGTTLEPGDQIVIVASTGLHANGASLAREIADRLPEGYETELEDGRLYGEALLDHAPLYVGLVARLLQESVPVTYLSHITGHGLLKVMRSTKHLTYRLSKLPEVPTVLQFIADKSRMDAKSAYSTLNMGCGYAVYCRPGHGSSIVEIAKQLGYDAAVSGEVDEGPRRVILEPVGVTLSGAEMELSVLSETRTAAG